MKRLLWIQLTLVTAVLALLGTACASKKSVDWNARVGSYTYDQVVLEMGPPARETKLEDGRKVAEWVTGYSSGGGLSLGIGSYGSHGGVGVSKSTGYNGRERVLRLTFDTENRLVEAKKN